MRFKKFFTSIFLVFIVFSYILPNISLGVDNNLNIYSPNAILIERETNKILYEKNAYEKKYPASTTKIMTAILALENCQLTDVATVSYDAIMTVPVGYTTANLQLGEELTIEQLLNLLLISSANDAGNVIAEHIAGSVESFATMMNTKAAELGCKNTHFTNPYGKQDSNHYSTAYDLALIANYCMDNSVFREIVRKTSYTLYPTNKYDKERVFTTTNSLIEENTSNRADNYYYERAIGIKTGYTTQAGNCLIGAAENDGLEFIAVVLDATQTSSGLSQRYLDTITLFDFAFDNYTISKVKSSNDFVKTVEISNATRDTKDLNLLVEDDIIVFTEKENINKTLLPDIKLNDNLQAPITKGDVVGTITYDIDGTKYTSNLLAADEVKEVNFLVNFIVILIIVFIVISIFKVYNGNFKKKRKKLIRRK